jgi:hypothetical protein
VGLSVSFSSSAPCTRTWSTGWAVVKVVGTWALGQNRPPRQNHRDADTMCPWWTLPRPAPLNHTMPAQPAEGSARAHWRAWTPRTTVGARRSRASFLGVCSGPRPVRPRCRAWRREEALRRLRRAVLRAISSSPVISSSRNQFYELTNWSRTLPRTGPRTLLEADVLP